MASLSNGSSSSAGTSSETNRFALSAITALFFMWGFLTALNDILIPHLKGVFDLNYTQSMLVQFTFFFAYFVMSLPSGKIIEKVGYRKGIMLGLITAGVGALLFYPAAALPNYYVFLGALFVLATGITVLQVAANPYVTALGPSDTASSRLNLSQAFNSLGTTLAPLIGGVLILGVVMSPEEVNTLNEAQLQAHKLAEAQSVQWPYIGLALTLFLLALVIRSLDLPKITQTDEENHDASSFTFGDAFKRSHLLFGVIGIFVYVGAEVSIGSFLVNYIYSLDIEGITTEKAASAYVSLYWGGAMIGRFIGSGLMQKLSPSKLLGTFALVAGALVVLTMNTFGSFAMYALLAVGLFNSIMFPTIFTLAIKDLGPLTSKGSSLLIMAIVGGAILPLAQGGIADAFGLKISFLIPVLCYLYISFYGFKGATIRSHM